MATFLRSIKVWYHLLTVWITGWLIMILGPSYKVRAMALLIALISSTIDYLATGGKPTVALLTVVWLGTVKAWFTKAINVTGIGADAVVLNNTLPESK